LASEHISSETGIISLILDCPLIFINYIVKIVVEGIVIAKSLVNIMLVWFVIYVIISLIYLHKSINIFISNIVRMSIYFSSEIWKLIWV